MSMPSSPTPSRWQNAWDIAVRDIGTIPAVVSLLAAHPKTFGATLIVGGILGFWLGRVV